MELFKAFLDETSGKHLYNFWLDAERFKDSLESAPEETLREQMTKLFRYVGTVSKVMDIFTRKQLIVTVQQSLKNKFEAPHMVRNAHN